MPPSTRRRFLGSLGAAALLPAAQTEPDLLLHHGNILTLDPQSPRAEAVAISGDRFLAVGRNDDVIPLATGRTRQVHLEGKTVVPGFIDAHTHLSYSGIRHLRQADCDLRSIAEIQAALRERATRTPPGQWVIGFKYDTKTSDGRRLTREDLDAAAPRHPVYVGHRGGHTAYVNSAAFRLAGVNEKTPDPPGGHIDRDPATGRLTGGLRERAIDPFQKLFFSAYTREEYREGVKIITRMMVRSGVTSAHDALGNPDDLRAYQDSYAAGELALRVYCLIDFNFLDRMMAAGLRTGLGNEWVRIGAVKMISDGSISERTAASPSPTSAGPTTTASS
jgi:predicted amidohydrolase YtcJ